MELDKFVIGLDVGTSTVRSLVFNVHGQVVGSAVTTVETISPQPGWVEIEPDKLWKKVVSVLGESISSAGLTAKQITSLGISCQRASFTCWHKETGEHFHNLITWQDLRADSYVKSWNSSMTMRGLRLGGKLLHWITRQARYKAAGILKLRNAMVTMRLLWVLDNVPKLRKAAEAGEAMFGCVDTWLLYKLTGKHVTEVSNIAATGLFDPFTMHYGTWAFSMFSIPVSILPKVVDSCGDHFGSTKHDLLGHSIPITAVLADQSASAFGSSCFKPGSAKITMGTGSFLDVVTDKPHASLKGLAPLVGWKVGDEITFLAEGSVHETGVMVNWARTVGLFDNIDEISESVSNITSSRGVYFVPGFHGLHAPVQDSTAAAGFIGLNLTSTKEEMVRAVLEAIAYSMLHLVEVFMSETGGRLEQIVVDGGVARNDFIVQLIADLTGVPLLRPGSVEVSAWGAAWLAGLGAGVWEDRDALALQSRDTGENFTRSEKWNVMKMKEYRKWIDACRRFTNWNLDDSPS